MPQATKSPIAVFVRNHPQYVQCAMRVAESDSERLVTFQSRRAWATAGKALQNSGLTGIPLFISVIGGPSLVTHRARLREVVLRPVVGESDCRRLLSFVPHDTKEEGLWKNGDGTLYALSGCHAIDAPFPTSTLLKAADNAPLSEDYHYAYSIVLDPEYLGDAQSQQPPASDVSPPPPRADAIVHRIIRDTVLVRRLKALHQDQCQLCGTRLVLFGDTAYSEAHHLQPLGRPHHGPDIEENIVIVCPNCHALLDYCAIPIVAGSFEERERHQVDNRYVQYHNRLHGRQKAR